MNAQRIASIMHTLNRYADQKNDLLLRHLFDDLKDAIFEENAEVDGLAKRERDYVATRQPIYAIKELRARYLHTNDPRGTLKGAKDVVEAYMAKHPSKEQ